MPLQRRWIWLVALALSALSACHSAPQENQAVASTDGPGAAVHDAKNLDELPIRRVVLYQNGVGYFEREGEIDSDVITLRIRPDQINDILKSLTVLDLDQKGKAISISLPVDKSAADALDDLPAQIQNEGGLLTLLRTFRGARVTLNTTAGAQDGRVVGVESIPSFNEQGHQQPGWRVMLQRTNGALDVVHVTDITGIRIKDQSLEVGLEKSLDVSLNEGSWKPIELKVRLESAVKRNVRVSYITEMPVWKPAYRLVIDDSGKGLFQGWGVVDNVSGGDWSKISMSLVAGNPISFVYNLYEPQFVSRPDLSGRVQYSAMAPPKVESVAYNTPVEETATIRLKEKGYGGEDLEDKDYRYAPEKADINGLVANSAPRAQTSMDNFQQSFGSVAQGQELSSLYEYKIGGDGEVTIPDRSSSLVNIVQASSAAKEIAIFQPQPGVAYNALNPYRAVEFDNGSGQPLEPGPISLYRARDGDSTFIGESFLEKTEKGEKAFFTFAMDPLVELATKEQERENLNQITRIKNGLITSEVRRVNTVTYTLKNKGDEALENVISRPKRPEWTLAVSDDAVIEEASQVNYLRVTVPAKSEVTVTLTETRVMPQQMRLNSYHATNMLDVQLSEDTIDPDLKKALADVTQKRAEIAALSEELSALRVRRSQLQEDQRLNADLLESIKDINNREANTLKQQYSRDMNNARTELVQVRADIALKENKAVVEQRTLDALYDNVKFGPQE